MFVQLNQTTACDVVDEWMGWDRGVARLCIGNAQQSLYQGLGANPMNECVWVRGGLRPVTDGKPFNCRFDFVPECKTIAFELETMCTLGRVKEFCAELTDKKLRFLHVPGESRQPTILATHKDAVEYPDDTLLINVAQVTDSGVFELVSSEAV